MFKKHETRLCRGDLNDDDDCCLGTTAVRTKAITRLVRPFLCSFFLSFLPSSLPTTSAAIAGRGR